MATKFLRIFTLNILYKLQISTGFHAKILDGELGEASRQPMAKRERQPHGKLPLEGKHPVALGCKRETLTQLRG